MCIEKGNIEEKTYDNGFDFIEYFREKNYPVKGTTGFFKVVGVHREIEVSSYARYRCPNSSIYLMNEETNKEITLEEIIDFIDSERDEIEHRIKDEKLRILYDYLVEKGSYTREESKFKDLIIKADDGELNV